MSVLVMSRGLADEAASNVEHVPIAALTRPDSYLAALAHWRLGSPPAWEAITSWRGQSWGDLVNEAVSNPDARKLLVGALGAIGRSCEELAIWYAGFPADVPEVVTPSEFERVVEGQLAAGNLEPAARIVRPARPSGTS